MTRPLPAVGPRGSPGKCGNCSTKVLYWWPPGEPPVLAVPAYDLRDGEWTYSCLECDSVGATKEPLSVGKRFSCKNCRLLLRISALDRSHRGAVVHRQSNGKHAFRCPCCGSTMAFQSGHPRAGTVGRCGHCQCKLFFWWN